jgi:hypothetical protein
VSGFTSEWRPASARNGVRHHLGIASGFKSESRPASPRNIWPASVGICTLVGRDEEIDLLLRRWKQAKSGNGQVVLISGEPGIGKSRIAETILERLGNEPHIRLRYFCSPYHQDSALYPSIAQLERAAGFRREDPADQRLNKLEAVLAQGTNALSEAVPLLADLLSISMADRYPPLNLTPSPRPNHVVSLALRGYEAFFYGDVMAGEETGERATACRDAPLTQNPNHLIQSQIRLLRDQSEDSLRVLLQGRNAPSARHRLRPAVVAKVLKPPDRRTNADVELLGCLSSRSACFHEINNPHSQRARIGSPHRSKREASESHSFGAPKRRRRTLSTLHVTIPT